MHELVRLSVPELRTRLDRREVSAVEVLAAHRERVADADAEIGAFLRVAPAAERDAAEADRRLARGQGGALTGIPVAIKDNLITRDLETTCGARILRGFRPTRDATAVARLREAGAVVLGKTNLDEFGMGSSTEHSSYRPTRNPWDRTRVPGGSSGGSAAAVAARMAPLALGSDTGGSVRQPAALCGVYGVKPTYGRVSRSGLVAFGSSLDQIGPLARTSRGAAAALGAIAGHDPRDSTSARQEVEDWVAACDGDVRGLRVGLPAEYLGEGLAPGIAGRLRDAAAILADAGASVEEVSLPHTRYAVPAYYLVATAEASSNLARFDGVRYGARHEAADDLHAMYRTTRGDGFGAEVRRRIMLGTFALSAGYHDRYYGTAQRARALVRADLERVFRDTCDVLLTPVTPTTAFPLGAKLDDPVAMYLSDVFTVPASLAGVPALSVPLGLDAAGLPIGGQIVAPHFAEDLLFRAAAALERHFPCADPSEVA